jgi:hypothetical protein
MGRRSGAALRLPLGVQDIQVRGARNSQAQPARKHNPPSGVTAPSQRKLVNAIAYKLPLKRKIPAENSHEAPRWVVPEKASTKIAIAWIKW